MKRASYRFGIFWIAANDDSEWVNSPPPADTASVAAALLADLFDVDTERVRKDLKRELVKQGRG